MPDLRVNDAGTWKAATPWVNDAGTWKKPQSVWVNDAGTWKQVWVAVTFDRPDGYSAFGTSAAAGSLSITASQPVVWTYTKSGQGNVNIASGATATTITFSAQKLQSGYVVITVGSHTWTLEADPGI